MTDASNFSTGARKGYDLLRGETTLMSWPIEPCSAPERSSPGVLDVICTSALLRLLARAPSDCERFLSLLRCRSLLKHADAIEALWGEYADGGPLYAQNILAIYASRLRRAGHPIETYPGVGYRLREPVYEIAADKTVRRRVRVIPKKTGAICHTPVNCALDVANRRA